VLTDTPKFLYSAAVIGCEMIKMTLSTLYILFVDKRPLSSIKKYLQDDYENTKILIVPATIYNLQQTLEYVALNNIDPSVFSVLVQSKMLMTAFFSVVILSKRLRKAQVISLIILTVGVILCNLKADQSTEGAFKLSSNQIKGTLATLGIACASGFSSVYTEKVIKGKGASKRGAANRKEYSLAYMQVQLAGVSLLVMGTYATFKDFDTIITKGLWHNFSWLAFFNIFNSGLGGLTVAAVLKFADSVLKGYATALSVVMTGILSKVLFGTTLSFQYMLGIVNVIVAVILYNEKF